MKWIHIAFLVFALDLQISGSVVRLLDCDQKEVISLTECKGDMFEIGGILGSPNFVDWPVRFADPNTTSNLVALHYLEKGLIARFKYDVIKRDYIFTDMYLMQKEVQWCDFVYKRTCFGFNLDDRAVNKDTLDELCEDGRATFEYIDHNRRNWDGNFFLIGKGVKEKYFEYLPEKLKSMPPWDGKKCILIYPSDFEQRKNGIEIILEDDGHPIAIRFSKLMTEGKSMREILKRNAPAKTGVQEITVDVKVNFVDGPVLENDEFSEKKE